MRLPFMLSILLLATPSADAFTAENLLQVNALQGAENFEVIGSVGSGPQQYWCAAADYARRTLGAPPATRLYLTGGLGPAQSKAGRKGVRFTTRPSEAQKNGPRPGDGGDYSVSLRKVGFNISRSMGEEFCIRTIDHVFWTDD